MAIMIDAIITLPVLFFICYRKSLSRKVMAIRIVGLQCLSIWLASKLVPANQQQILPWLEWFRYAGLAVLVIFEVKLIAALVRLIVKPGVTEAELKHSGMPRLIAKWAVIEARFWRWVFRLFKR